MQDFRKDVPSASARELNNVLQVISGTAHLLEDIWAGNADSEKYLAMLRASVDRAANATAHLVAHSGGVNTPQILVAQSPDVPAPPGLANDDAAPRRQRLLVVDDDEAAVDLFRHFLVEDGYDVATAQSGFECLDVFVRNDAQFDLVLLDLTMPFMDGDETFRRLRIISPDVKVLLSTGFIQQKKLDSLFADGLTGFAPKPLLPHELLAAVGRIVRPQQFANGGTALAM